MFSAFSGHYISRIEERGCSSLEIFTDFYTI